MKRFFKKLVVFVIVILAVSLVIQGLVNIRMKHKVIYGCDNLDVEEGQYHDLVFLGSSRCYAHFSPVLFEQQLGMSAINLGVDGHSELTMHKLRLLNYLARNKAPRYAILNFDPLVWPGSIEDNDNMIIKDRYARYAFFPSSADAPIVDYFHFNFAEKYIPFYALLRYKLVPKCITLPNDKTWRMQRYNKVDDQWDTTVTSVRREEELMHSYFDTSEAGIKKLEVLLRSLDSICTNHGTRLICVQTPVYKSIYLKRNFAITGQICSQLRIPFIDVNKEDIDTNIDYFYNANHLNTKGVAAMTKELCSDSSFRKLLKPV